MNGPCAIASYFGILGGRARVCLNRNAALKDLKAGCKPMRFCKSYLYRSCLYPCIAELDD